MLVEIRNERIPVCCFNLLTLGYFVTQEQITNPGAYLNE